MNLRDVANAYTQTVNPNTSADVWRSTGYTTAPTGHRVPAFTNIMSVDVQQQALSGEELKHLDSLNIQGILRAVYANGDLQGVNRSANTGGDVLAFDGQWWLVVHVIEPWATTAGWTKVAVQLQNGKPEAIP